MAAVVLPAVTVPDTVVGKPGAQAHPAFALPPSPPLSDSPGSPTVPVDVAAEERAATARLAAAAARVRLATDDEVPEDEQHAQPLEIERPLGETELSYFLPSREDGVNDMCVSRCSLCCWNLLSKERWALRWVTILPQLISLFAREPYPSFATITLSSAAWSSWTPTGFFNL